VSQAADRQDFSADQQRAAPPPQRTARIEHAIGIEKMCDGMKGELGDLETALKGPQIQGLDIFQAGLPEKRLGIVSGVLDQLAEDESIIGTR
jgi:hypothetical protein